MMCEASRALGAAFCPGVCASTKTENPATAQSAHEQTIALLKRAGLERHLKQLTTCEKGRKLNSHSHE